MVSKLLCSPSPCCLVKDVRVQFTYPTHVNLEAQWWKRGRDTLPVQTEKQGEFQRLRGKIVIIEWAFKKPSVDCVDFFGPGH